MIRPRFLPSLAALIVLSVACFAGCGGSSCDDESSTDACNACEEAHTSCVKACTTQSCNDACNSKRDECSNANCHFCG